MESRSILVLAFSPLHRDGRIHRQLTWLEPFGKITVTGYTPPGQSVHAFVPINPFHRSIFEKIRMAGSLKCRSAESVYFSDSRVQEALTALKGQRFDWVVANDLETLPLAVALTEGTSAKIILDAHEYTPRQFDSEMLFQWFWQPYWTQLARQYLPKVHLMYTVCEGIAAEYSREFKVACGVITNAPEAIEASPRVTLENSIRLVHSGLFKVERELEQYVELVQALDSRFELDFYLMPSQKNYEAKFRKWVQDYPRVSIKPAQTLQALVTHLNANYDMALLMFSPKSFNYKHILPNKFFEGIQARLAIATWPSEELVPFIDTYSFGVYSQRFTFDSLAARLNALTSGDIDAMKHNAHRAASRLNAKANQQILKGWLSQL